jgi:hypothetical protein
MVEKKKLIKHSESVVDGKITLTMISELSNLLRHLNK